MNDGEVMGKMRLAATTLAAARDTLTEAWEDGEVMLSPVKSAELRKIAVEMSESFADLKPVVDNFTRVAGERVPQA